MARQFITSMGGLNSRFLTTEWGLISQARSQNEAQGNAIAGELAGKYWKPVYCYLRRKGYADQEAKDLTPDPFRLLHLLSRSPSTFVAGTELPHPTVCPITGTRKGCRQGIPGGSASLLQPCGVTLRDTYSPVWSCNILCAMTDI